MRALVAAALALSSARSAPVDESLISQIPDLDEHTPDDAAADGRNTYAEYMGYPTEGYQYYEDAWRDDPTEEEVAGVFGLVDMNRDGKISVKEIRSALTSQLHTFLEGEREVATRETRLTTPPPPPHPPPSPPPTLPSPPPPPTPPQGAHLRGR